MRQENKKIKRAAQHIKKLIRGALKDKNRGKKPHQRHN